MADTERIPSQISRRHFIFGAGALSVLTLAYAGLRQTGCYEAETLELTALSDKAAAIYRKAGRILIPETEWFPGHGGDDETLYGIDRMMQGVPEGSKWKLNALPLVFEHGTALDRYGSKRLSALSDDDAHAYLQRWSESSLLIKAQLMIALKTMYAFSYFERGDVLAAMGRTPHCVTS